MGKYLLVESRDPFTASEVLRDYDLAANLAKDGNEVTLFLVQNGVLPARSGVGADHLRAAIEAGVEVLADEFSVRERGISNVVPGVRAATLDTVVDNLAEGRKAIWL